jgi:tetratricopeptide (TPR) repeat protein
VLVTHFLPASAVFWAADAVLALPGASEHPKYPAALVVAGFAARHQGDQKLARQRCDDALVAQARLGTEPSIGIPLNLTWIALAQGDPDAMAEYTQQAVEMARGRHDTAWLLQALAQSALARTMARDTARAHADAHEILALRHQLANTNSVSAAVLLAIWALRDSEPERALILAREIIEATGSGSVQSIWTTAGDIAAYNGKRREALGYFERAIDTTNWLGLRPELRASCHLVAILLADDDPEASAALFGAGDALAADYVHTPHHVDARQHAITTLKASLGADHYTELYTRGAAMDDPDATQYARAAINRALAKDSSD